jgi:hypothetical protein
LTGPTGPAPTGSTGQVVYLSSSGVSAAASNFYWDSTNSRVGVGTASPGTALDVNGVLTTRNDISTTPAATTLYSNNFTFRWNEITSSATGNPRLRIDSSGANSGSNQILQMGLDGAVFYKTAYLDTVTGGVSDVVPLAFRISGSEKMRVNTNGNVGIGTASPGYPFDVSGTIRGNNEIISTGTGTSQFRAISGNYGFFIRNDGTDSYLLHTASGDPYGSYTANRPFRINNATALVTMGNGLSLSGGSGTYTLTVTGTIGSTGDITAFTSDERLKTKTGALTGALDKVCTLDTFTYTHNDLARSFGFTDNRQYVGISAQQVRKVQPEVVRMAPFDADGEKSKSGEDYITVQYERLVPLLIEALKEERKAREALEERIKLLEQK